MVLTQRILTETYFLQHPYSITFISPGAGGDPVAMKEAEGFSLF